MKLKSGNDALVIDYYPVQFVDGTLLDEWFLKIVYSEKVDKMSKRFIRKNDMFDEINERIEYGYEVIDFNTVRQVGNPITGICSF
tara:strand:- start:4828 stop:5082 length:255 start_codon:yes stop_codon:yes gene_type:complete